MSNGLRWDSARKPARAYNHELNSRLLRSDDEAEDVMQEAYARAYQHLKLYMKGWDAYDARGGQSRHTRSGAKAYHHELRLVQEGAIDSLPEIYLMVFVLG